MTQSEPLPARIFDDLAIQESQMATFFKTWPVPVSIGMAEASDWPDGFVAWICPLHLDEGVMTEREFLLDHVKPALAEHQATLDHCCLCGSTEHVVKDPPATVALKDPFPCVVVHDNGNRTQCWWPGGTVSYFSATSMCKTCLEWRFNWHAHYAAEENMLSIPPKQRKLKRKKPKRKK